MPLYDFRCSRCGDVFEVHASIKEKEAGLLPECPRCHSQETRQLISSVLMIRASGGAAPPFPACGPDDGPGCC